MPEFSILEALAEALTLSEERKRHAREMIGYAPNYPLSSKNDVALWNRRNELRQEMGPVEPIGGAHLISAAQKAFRALAPDWDWTLRKLASGDFQDKSWGDVWASANAWDPEHPEERLLAGIPGAGVGGPIRSAQGPAEKIFNKLPGNIRTIFKRAAEREPVILPWLPEGFNPAHDAWTLKTPKSTVEGVTNAIGITRKTPGYRARGTHIDRWPDPGGMVISNLPYQKKTLGHEYGHDINAKILGLKTAPGTRDKMIKELGEAIESRGVLEERPDDLLADLLEEIEEIAPQFAHTTSKGYLKSDTLPWRRGDEAFVRAINEQWPKPTSSFYTDSPALREWWAQNSDRPIIGALREMIDRRVPREALAFPGYREPLLYGFPGEGRNLFKLRQQDVENLPDWMQKQWGTTYHWDY